MTWKVIYYKTKSGKIPVEEFVNEQDDETQTRIRGLILLLGNNGPFLKPPYIKKLQTNLYELRIKSRILVRIFYSPKKNSYYLLHAFKKKSQKTPLKELRLAIDRMKDII